MLKLFRKKPKLFCVGCNKTGTTSLEQALRDFGYRIGKQAQAEDLLYDWHRRDFNKLINYCRSADAFQDIPFSLAGTYRAVDQAFPGSKFILTVRNSPDEWFSSLKRYHEKLFNNGNPVEEIHLASAKYHRQGWMLDCMKLIFNYPDVPLYTREPYIAIYEKHNADILDYFKDRPDDLLVLNVAEEGAYNKLRVFLGLKPDDGTFPWLLKS